MSTPTWISQCCQDEGLVINATPTRTMLNELSTFLESNPSIPNETILLYPTLSRATVKAIFKGLQQNSTIHTLTILASNNSVTQSTLNEWTVGFSRAPSLTTLELVSNFHTGSSGTIQPWLRSLQLNTSITSLIFQECQFGPSDVTELIALLSSSYSITELEFILKPNQMGPDEFVRLCTHLKSDPFIKSLTIGSLSHPVQNHVAMSLAQALKTNNTLTSIKLLGCEISEGVQPAFAVALNYNTTLTVLDLPSKGQDDDYQKLLRSALRRNRDLVHSPLELLLRQTELTKETERRRGIKQTKLDAFKQTHPSSFPKSVHQLTDEEKEEGQSVKKKPKLELSTSSVIQSTPLSVRLNEYEAEYLRVSLDFLQSFAGMPDYHGLKFEVTQIQRITNPVLQNQFDQSYRYFMTHNYHSKHPIRSVYHSTKPKNISSIIQSNLSPEKSGSETDSGWFGRGMYFSPHADYTFMYYSTGQFEQVAAGDRGKVLQFDILPGRMLHMVDVKVGGERTPYYDSHVSPNEFEYVIFDSRHVLPRYIISFNVIEGAGQKFEGSIEQVGPDHSSSSRGWNPFY